MDTAPTYDELYEAAMQSHDWRFVEHLHLKWCDACDAEYNDEHAYAKAHGELVLPMPCPGAPADKRHVSKYAAMRRRVDAIVDRIEASHARLPILNNKGAPDES